MQTDELLEDARQAMKKSYNTYSHFAVGAALRTEQGKVFTGTNIENASFSLSICAERVAIFKAVSEGYRSFTDLAIVSSSQIPAFPCGACRQVLQEFSPRIMIYIQDNDKQGFSLTDLLPNPFGSDTLPTTK
jgi:cytidine deaminase